MVFHFFFLQYEIVLQVTENFFGEFGQDWEEGLSENEADGSFLHENWNNDLKLFSGGEDGGHQLIQVYYYF